MTRIIEKEFETTAAKAKTAIERFFRKYPELEYWRGTLEWMAENGKSFENDGIMGDGSRNKDWRFALHFVVNENYLDSTKDDFYICIIERV